MQRRQATLDAVSSRVAVRQDGDPNRKRAVDEVKKFLGKKSLLKDPKTVKTYTCNQPIVQVFQQCRRRSVARQSSSLYPLTSPQTSSVSLGDGCNSSWSGPKMGMLPKSCCRRYGLII
jgi:hypothetical protein